MELGMGLVMREGYKNRKRERVKAYCILRK